ncbi:Flp family type IVb pilin [Roseomonas sp. JC162]|uniref:Flp family type IVb pilin n=1 Tax=Neoroseomonas marina TaxID=1232220 RepID=A0A848E946_9PROT|nr:Flp family type IVb pilin [Neoroseomonas marina]NMJ39745.1 Flp family type IVb pilin [Neoroseomonas marina]
MLHRFVATLRDKKGVSAAEYAILAVGVVIVVGAAISSFGGALTNAFSNVGTQMSSTQASLQSSTSTR